MERDELEDNFNKQCRTCLSIGRKMLLLGELAHIYLNLTSDYEFLSSRSMEHLSLCWECHAFLNNIKKFLLKLKRSNEMIRLGQNNLCSLSNLTTVIFNSNQPNSIFVFNQLPDLNIIKTDKHITANGVFKNSEESDYTTDCNDFDQLDAEKEIKEKSNNDLLNNKNNDALKKRNINKWAKKRLLLNKKPKYKLIADSKFHIDTIFTKLPNKINEEELKRCILKERESEYNKSKKLVIGRCDKRIWECLDGKTLLKPVKMICDESAEPYTCDICSERFSDKHSLTEHLQNHYDMYQCRLCNYLCSNKRHRYRHVEITHGSVLQCLKCEMLFGNRREFFKHYKEWHEKFICDQCGISFKMRYCIKDHIRKQHSSFECRPCAKRFTRYNGLWLHKKLQHGASTTPPAYCVECDKLYPDHYRYKWHLANSARHKPRQKLKIPCPECDKVFTKNIYMKDHHNLVHLKHYKYRCEECDKNFIRNADLKKHNRRVHEGIMPPRNKICNICGRGFTTNKILANHVRTHTGERPYECTQCSACFAQAAALASHVRSVHNC